MIFLIGFDAGPKFWGWCASSWCWWSFPLH